MERIVIDNSETFFKDILDKRSRFEENNLKSYGGDNYRLLGDYIEIFNSNFKTDIFLNSIDLKVGIRVVNCEFQSFTLENCRAEIDSNYFGRNYGVEIENSIFKKLNFNNKNIFKKGISIINSEVHNLFINNVIINDESLIINSSKIYEFTISNCKKLKQIQIKNNCQFLGLVSIVHSEIDYIIIENSEFSEKFDSDDLKINNLTLVDNTFKNDIKFSTLSISSFFNIHDNIFKKSFLVQSKNSYIGFLEISSNQTGDQFIITGNGLEITSINIVCSKQFEGSYFFSYLKISALYISGDNYNSKIEFTSCEFNKVQLSGFNNYGKLSFNEIQSYKTNSIIQFQDSLLGLTHVYSSNIDSFDTIFVLNCILTDIIFINVNWCNSDKLNINYPYEVIHISKEYLLKNLLIARKEVFRQLKYSLENQGNRTESLKFKALEMSALKKEKFYNVKWFKKPFNIDRIILWLSQSNSFGENFLKPIGLAFIFNFIFYLLIITSISNKLHFGILDFNYNSLSTTYDEFSKYFYLFAHFLNPTHSLDSLIKPTCHFSFLTILLDYIQKIGMAYFIFQIVSAFRKYLKS